MHAVEEVDGAQLRMDNKCGPSEEAQDLQAPVDDDAAVERQKDRNASVAEGVKMELAVEDPLVDSSPLCHCYHFRNYCYRHSCCSASCSLDTSTDELRRQLPLHNTRTAQKEKHHRSVNYSKNIPG